MGEFVYAFKIIVFNFGNFHKKAIIAETLSTLLGMKVHSYEQFLLKEI